MDCAVVKPTWRVPIFFYVHVETRATIRAHEANALFSFNVSIHIQPRCFFGRRAAVDCNLVVADEYFGAFYCQCKSNGNRWFFIFEFMVEDLHVERTITVFCQFKDAVAVVVKTFSKEGICKMRVAPETAFAEHCAVPGFITTIEWFGWRWRRHTTPIQLVSMQIIWLPVRIRQICWSTVGYSELPTTNVGLRSNCETIACIFALLFGCFEIITRPFTMPFLNIFTIHSFAPAIRFSCNFRRLGRHISHALAILAIESAC